MVKTTTAVILASVSVWGLTACGGGGGGSSSSSSVDDTPTERPSSADITVDPNGYAEKQVAISSQTETDSILELYEDAENAYLLAEQVDNAVTSRSPSDVSGNVLTYDCDNDGEVVITVNSDDVSDDERWKFNNCELDTPTFGRIVLNGDYSYVNEVMSNGNAGFQVFDLTGTVIASGDDIVAKGLDEWDIGENTEKYRTDALEFIIGNDYFAIANALTTLEDDGSGVSISLESKLIGSALGGYINISTQKSVFVASGESCPQSGIIRLDGDSSTFAEIRYLDDTGTGDVAMVVIDSSGEAVPYNTCESLIF
ncbi:hypothetical protein MARLIPOL_16949 [Marinobacter lipolyticus SM19]|uniref:Lipoprotein n=1 Tax=Marinobacter lipolyticus SM19 TaxID=1318628 RepID=R8AWV6_9GAMM|nr:hypothetical protein [Marinobacter lipolyticus]EON90828.1 hypothetical protein MARLIPOL_16949 [Marinobacter lipolyticus SM19]